METTPGRSAGIVGIFAFVVAVVIGVGAGMLLALSGEAEERGKFTSRPAVSRTPPSQ